MDFLDNKQEVEHALGLDLKPGDKLRRINLPEGWPEQTLTVLGHVLHPDDVHGPMVTVHGDSNAYQTMMIFTRNIGVLYERV